MVTMGEVRLLEMYHVTRCKIAFAMAGDTHGPTDGFSGFRDFDRSLFFAAVTCCWNDRFAVLLVETGLPARCFEKLS